MKLRITLLTNVYTKCKVLLIMA